MEIADVKPVGTRVLIEPYVPAERSKSGLVMENSSNTSVAPVLGTVIRAGEKSQYKSGERVLFRRFSVDKLTVITSEGEKDISLVDDDDILALVEAKKNKQNSNARTKKAKSFKKE